MTEKKVLTGNINSDTGKPEYKELEPVIDQFDLDVVFKPTINIHLDINKVIEAASAIRGHVLTQAIAEKNLELFQYVTDKNAADSVMGAIGHLIWYAQYHRYNNLDIHIDENADMLARFENLKGKLYVLGAVYDKQKLTYSYHS